MLMPAIHLFHRRISMISRKETLREELERDLPHFTGTEEYSRICYPWLHKAFLLTDGVKYLVDKAKAYWLIDIIASHQSSTRVRSEPFQVWQINVCLDGGFARRNDPAQPENVRSTNDFQSPKQTDSDLNPSATFPLHSIVREWKMRAKPGNALVTCEDGNGKVLAVQNIPFSDFPLPDARLFLVNDDIAGMVVMLPSEY
jgi:hypothetical protein